MRRAVYIRAIASLSTGEREPDYSSVLSMNERRRMGPLLRRAVAVSRQVLSLGGIPLPDAIICGTGWGCLENTELFLRALQGIDDKPLKPTHFMLSTHNTPSSTLGISASNHGYNATHSQDFVSFESALLDAFLQIGLGEKDSALVGAFDETTEGIAQVVSPLLDIRPSSGELPFVSMAVLLTSEREGALCELRDVVLGSGLPAPTEGRTIHVGDLVPSKGTIPTLSAVAFEKAVGEVEDEGIVHILNDSFPDTSLCTITKV